jgi:renalase
MTQEKAMSQGNPQKIALIGGGIAGLVCARELADAGIAVVVFDKSRGLGGRVCTRRHDDMRFDHGAQYFTTSSEAFETVTEQWSAAEVVAPWVGQFALWRDGEFVPIEPNRQRWVATPRMSGLGRFLGQDLDCRLEHRVNRLTRDDGAWSVHIDGRENIGGFDAVILTCPGPQAAALLPAESRLQELAASVRYAPCWAVMMSFDTRVDIAFDGTHLDDHPIGWMARDSSKPGRAPGERWVIHGSPSWSQAQLEAEPDDVIAALSDAFETLSGHRPQSASAHRWRYALCHNTEGRTVQFDRGLKLGLCGDAFTAPKVEGAWLSGQAMAHQLLTHPLR